LTVGLQETFDGAGRTDAAAVASVRRDEGRTEDFLRSLAQLWVRGMPVDWSPTWAGRPVRTVELPTYPFQRQRYWLAPPASGTGDLASVGLSATEHPLAPAGLELAGRDELVLSARLSLRTHPWLADHAVLGTALLPGTAWVD